MASSDPSNIESNHSSSEEEEVAIARRTAIRSPSKTQWELVGPRRSRRSSSNSTSSTSYARPSRSLNLESQEEFPPLQLSRSPSSGEVDPYAQVVTEAIR